MRGVGGGLLGIIISPTHDHLLHGFVHTFLRNRSRMTLSEINFGLQRSRIFKLLIKLNRLISSRKIPPSIPVIALASR